MFTLARTAPLVFFGFRLPAATLRASVVPDLGHLHLPLVVERAGDFLKLSQRPRLHDVMT